ncbi:glycosyltransferase family 2 protein [Methylobacter sp. S3L5C]|uniref:glycosyltransferase family 2 protein n=1 Tax=Methylobacter sp. S3L5C TaxID=2839024 RepID=UPI001FAD78C9|nr:glycosyltransferase family 2 protein [Methylobacter sp. S3L5C]UOA10199.1 glycosyltransferase [Methylobacter sp. S3L5C]
MSHLVSILIPAYNAEKWVAETITSALSQTWPNKEIIIVNDGSTDDTLSVAKSFESKYVKVVTQENSGASSARNKALSFAQGDYIQWLDADDLLAPDKISKQMKVAETGHKNLQLLSSAYGVFHYRINKARFTPNGIWRDLSPIDWITENFTDGKAYMVPAAWLISRKLTDEAGFWDERLSLNDDGEYICRVVLSSEAVKFVSTAKSYYRSTGFTQLSRDTSEKGIQSLLLSLKLSIQHLRSFEDNERTRKLSVALLQMYSQFFLTENPELLEEINVLAFELGGQFTPPILKWKSSLLGRLLGQKAAEVTIDSLRKIKFSTVVKWDEMLFIAKNGNQ